MIKGVDEPGGQLVRVLVVREMAALPAGVQYGLSSEPGGKENKELVFVKLTDSALKAIEDFIRNNRDKLATPKIQFLPGNEGKISIPTGGVVHSGEATFRFSINSNAEMEGPQGSFECVRSNARLLESCGALPRRMRVHANDDSYEATKDRMSKSIAAEQSKCTRVIKPNQTDIGRRVKVRSVTSSYPMSVSHPAPQPAAPPPVQRPAPPQPPPPPHSQPHPHPQPHSQSHQQPQSHSQLHQQPQSHSQPHQQPQSHQHPMHMQRPPANPELGRRSIKERLIQLLALKPFKKPELYSRLNLEGIKEKERTVVNKILPQIGTLKDNCYHLRRHIWNDVNEDWPFYSEEEKRMLKRRKPQNLTPPLSSDSTNSLSPRDSPSATKRSGVAGPADDVPSKKQRISHYKRPTDPRGAHTSGSPSSGYATGGSGASSGERHVSDNEDERTGGEPIADSVQPASEKHLEVKKDNSYTLNYNTVKDLCPSPAKSNNSGYRNSPPVEQSSITDTEITNNEPIQNTELTSAPDENPVEQEEIERQYPPITSSSTRRRYKTEFARLYEEYRALYKRVARVAQLFTSLEQKLKRAPPHSPHHQSIEQRIFEEYGRLRADAEYQQQRGRVNYLHRKLQHIKHMVQQYDNPTATHIKEYTELPRSTVPEHISTPSTTQAY